MLDGLKATIEKASAGPAFGIGVITFAVMFWLLDALSAMLVPLAIAVLVWAIVNALSGAIAKLRIGRWCLPQWFTLGVALIIVMTGLILVVALLSQYSTTIANDIIDMRKLDSVIAQITSTFGEPRILADLISREELESLRNTIIAEAAVQLSGMLGNFILIFVYVLFLLVEQHTFGMKIRTLVSERGRQETFINMFSTLAQRVQYYLWVKTLMSLLTAVISYTVLQYMDVNYALFWSFVIFVLNYVPTIGSILGVIFPAIQVLFQFNGDLTPFITVVVLLGLVPQFAIGNLLEPRVMGISLNLSPIVILLSLAFWFIVWKIPGLFLAVPVTVIIMIICAHFDYTRGFAVLLSSNGQILDFVRGGESDPTVTDRNGEG